jgi:hypothetical protein
MTEYVFTFSVFGGTLFRADIKRFPIPSSAHLLLLETNKISTTSNLKREYTRTIATMDELMQTGLLGPEYRRSSCFSFGQEG